MNKYLFLLVSVLLLTACNSKTKFKVSGNITDSKNQILYLEHTALIKTTIIDSIKLDDDGSFSFKGPRPEYPDFYRLRIGYKVINFSVDSCEKITIKASNNQFSSNYIIEGSQTSIDIQKLRKSLTEIQRKVNDLSPDLTTDARTIKVSAIEKEIEIHKEMAKKLILQNPRSSAAYYAIYQKINDTYLFSPYNKEDRPFCAAVATAYNTFMPEYERSKNIYSLVMDAITSERQEKNKQAWADIVEKSGIGYIDIELKDKNDQVRKLSENEGKVVLIDFSSYEMENSVQYTFELRDLYNKYSAKGLEIYQVSLDRSILLWKNSTESIPWICVRDENGPNSKVVASYNIQKIPTLFLLNRKGLIVGRDYDFKTLENEIKKSL